MSERVIQAAIMAALAREVDVWPMRNTTGSTQEGSRWITYGLGKGSPDIVAILAPWGHWVGIEVKAPGGRVRRDQVKWLKLAARMGATVGVAYSVEDALQLVQTARDHCNTSQSLALKTGNASVDAQPAPPPVSTRSNGVGKSRTKPTPRRG